MLAVLLFLFQGLPTSRRLGRPGGWAVVGLVAFVGLTWVRAASLAAMLPAVLNLALGALAGVLGFSLGPWLGALGVRPGRASALAGGLKLAQLVSVPLGYRLLGGHMLAGPLLGAGLALLSLGWRYRRGLGGAR